MNARKIGIGIGFLLVLVISGCKETPMESKAIFSYPAEYSYNATGMNETVIVTITRPGIAFRITPLPSAMNEQQINAMLEKITRQLDGARNVTRWENDEKRYSEQIIHGTGLNSATIVSSMNGTVLVEGWADITVETQFLEDKKIILETIRVTTT